MFVAQVSAVNEDGTVSLAWGAAPVLNVPCSTGYIGREVGQSVLVARVNKQLIVVGTTAQPDPQDQQELADQADLDATNTTLDALVDYAHAVNSDAQRLDSIRPRITFGTAAAPSGFLQADSVWFKDQGGGRVDFYFKRSSDAGSGSSAPPTSTKPPVSSPPVSRTLQPNSQGSWRSSGQTDSQVWQGDWTGRGNWLGGWFYGTSIADACSGKSVKSMTFTISRTNNGSGWNHGVPAHLKLHGRTSKGKPSPTGDGSRAVTLSPGQLVRFSLPGGWVSALASGSARGFMISGSGRSDYMCAGGASGKLVITFN